MPGEEKVENKPITPNAKTKVKFLDGRPSPKLSPDCLNKRSPKAAPSPNSPFSLDTIGPTIVQETNAETSDDKSPHVPLPRYVNPAQTKADSYTEHRNKVRQYNPQYEENKITLNLPQSVMVRLRSH